MACQGSASIPSTVPEIVLFYLYGPFSLPQRLPLEGVLRYGRKWADTSSRCEGESAHYEFTPKNRRGERPSEGNPRPMHAPQTSFAGSRKPYAPPAGLAGESAEITSAVLRTLPMRGKISSTANAWRSARTAEIASSRNIMLYPRS